MIVRLLCVGAVLLAAPLTGQGLTLRLRPFVPMLPEPVSPSLGIVEDSLHATPGGVLYQDLTLGNGAEALLGDAVAVRFVGFLANGEKVTQSAAEPLIFRLGDRKVIQGWEEGVLGMRVGGRRILVIPARLGYGQKASGPIPANATLVFDIILVDRP